MKENQTPIYIKEYTYDLPHERIAEAPLEIRDQSKLLVYKEGKIEDDQFYHLPTHLPEKTRLVLNNTKVIEARIIFQKATGGLIEIFCLEPAGEKVGISDALGQTGSVQWNCLIGGASKWKAGQVLSKPVLIQNKPATLFARYINKVKDSFTIEFYWEPAELSFAELLHSAGAIPLPPYIKRTATEKDAERYQTVFAQHQGSVAAPTASLHFTPQVFEKLKTKEVSPLHLTLHVGAGTFKPVKTETIAEHEMHAEHFHVTRTSLEGLIDAEKIIAAGTTSLRALESLYWIGVKLQKGKYKEEDTELFLNQWEAYDYIDSSLSYQESLQVILQHLDDRKQEQVFCRTSLIIVPGYRFRSAIALITNFHQPQSTLLLLVAAFIGEDWKKIYQHALDNEYRFLSYGDSSLLWRKP